MATPTTLLKVMIDAVRKAAKGLTRDFGELSVLQVSKKGLADYVSAADVKAEAVLFEELAKVRPGYSFLGEERGLVEGTDKTHTWDLLIRSTALPTSCIQSPTSRSAWRCSARARSPPG